MNGDKRTCVLFVLAFGEPRPFHRISICNWSRVTSAHFVIITDNPEKWSQVVGSTNNISLIPISIDDYFGSFYSLFDVSTKDEFITEYGHAFFGAVNGWTACGLRPLLRLVLNAGEYPEPLWGWMDYDVLLDAEGFERAIESCVTGDSQGAFFSREGRVWEQLKVFRNEYSLFEHYDKMLQAASFAGKVPMEARLSCFIRDQGLVQFRDFPQESLCAHWKFTDDITSPLPNRYEVIARGPACLARNSGGHAVVVFLADTECRVFSDAETEQVMGAWQEGRPVVFPHRKRPA